MVSDQTETPYTIVRKNPKSAVSSAFWRTDFKGDSLVILSPPKFTNEQLSCRLIEIGEQLRETQ